MPPTPEREWFDETGAPPATPPGAPAGGGGGGGGGLRFACTQCGRCCSGPEGYVLFTEDEAAAIARRLGVSVERFITDYTKDSPAGRSLRENRTPHGFDCVFLDRATVPGKAICSIYEDRPAQCRTWPFWESNLRSRAHWDRAGRMCPGINKGTLVPPERIRIQRAVVDR